MSRTAAEFLEADQRCWQDWRELREQVRSLNAAVERFRRVHGVVLSLDVRWIEDDGKAGSFVVASMEMS